MSSGRKCSSNTLIKYVTNLCNQPHSCRLLRVGNFGCSSLLVLVCLSTAFAFVAASSDTSESSTFRLNSNTTVQSDSAGRHTRHQNMLERPRGGHQVDWTEQRIVSRLTSQEMDEKYWLDSAPDPQKPRKTVLRRSDGTGESPKIPDGTRIITIPMSAVPPRLQSPGSSRGMPPTIRIVEIDHSQKTFFQKVFRRAIHSEPAPKKNIFSVDLHGGIIGVGEYYSVIELGSKRIRVQVDTGSSTLAGSLIVQACGKHQCPVIESILTWFLWNYFSSLFCFP